MVFCSLSALVVTLAGAPSSLAADPGAPDAADGPVVVACGEGDRALGRVAAHVARRHLEGEGAPSADELAAMTRAAGAPFPWPRVVVFSGRSLDRAQVAARARAWADALPGGDPRRCGVGSASDERGETAIAVIAARAPASIAGLPSRVRPGGWVTVDVRVRGDSTGASVVVLGPRGAPRVVPSTFSEGRVVARFSADRPGNWLVQVLAERPEGPVPVIDAVVRAEATPARAPGGQVPAVGAPGGRDEAVEVVVDDPVPGEDERGPTPETSLARMLAAARVAEGLPALERDARLDAVARAHARKMAAAGRLAHDLGAGDPTARVEAGGVDLDDADEVGENVAHAASAAAAHRALWQSPSHRANLVSTRHRSWGLGLVRGDDGSLWVAQVFVSAR